MLILDRIADLDEATFPLSSLIGLARDAITLAIFTPVDSKDPMEECMQPSRGTRVPHVYLQIPYFELLRQSRACETFDTPPATEVGSVDAQSFGNNNSDRSRSELELNCLDKESRRCTDDSNKGRQPSWLNIIDRIHALPRSMRRALFSGIAAVQFREYLKRG